MSSYTRHEIQDQSEFPELNDHDHNYRAADNADNTLHETRDAVERQRLCSCMIAPFGAFAGCCDVVISRDPRCPIHGKGAA